MKPRRRVTDDAGDGLPLHLKLAAASKCGRRILETGMKLGVVTG